MEAELLVLTPGVRRLRAFGGFEGGEGFEGELDGSVVGLFDAVVDDVKEFSGLFGGAFSRLATFVVPLVEELTMEPASHASWRSPSGRIVGTQSRQQLADRSNRPPDVAAVVRTPKGSPKRKRRSPAAADEPAGVEAAEAAARPDTAAVRAQLAAVFSPVRPLVATPCKPAGAAAGGGGSPWRDSPEMTKICANRSYRRALKSSGNVRKLGRKVPGAAAAASGPHERARKLRQQRAPKSPPKAEAAGQVPVATIHASAEVAPAPVAPAPAVRAPVAASASRAAAMPPAQLGGPPAPPPCPQLAGPPAPPLPPGAGPPPPPPPPPPPHGGLGGAATATSMVNAYQKRLRSKTSTRSSGGGGGKVAAKAETSPKEQQWLSINAKARGITEAEFTALAAEKHEEIASLVRLVEAFCEGDPDALLAKTQDVTQWFCGGSKELTMRFPSWASLERKLEAMISLQTVQKAAVSATAELGALAAAIEAAPSRGALAEGWVRSASECHLKQSRLLGNVSEFVSSWQTWKLPFCEATLRTLFAAWVELVSVLLSKLGDACENDDRLANCGAANGTRARTAIAALLTSVPASLRVAQQAMAYAAEGLYFGSAEVKAQCLRELLALRQAAETCLCRSLRLSLVYFDDWVAAQDAKQVRQYFEAQLKGLDMLRTCIEASLSAGAARRPAPAQLRSKDKALAKQSELLVQRLLGHISKVGDSLDIMGDIASPGGRDGDQRRKQLAQWIHFGCAAVVRSLKAVELDEKRMQRILAEFIALERHF